MRVRRMVCVLGALAVSGAAIAPAASAANDGESIARKAAKGKVKAAVLQMQVVKDGQVVTVTRTLPFLSAGTIAAAEAAGVSAGQEPTASDPNRHTIAGGPGTGHTYDAASDPAVAMDSRGRGYFSCVMFDVASNASGLFVTQSPEGAHGSFFFNVTSRPFMVAE